ncbi:hypothetical protein RJ55_01366 [Drechmeria coniospora]|nr:hypothetical protein RJ55_01366 [Drechmeria coniospora]
MASPDGKFVATLAASVITVRSTATLRIVNVARLPQGLGGTLDTLCWAPSSTKILASTADQIHLVSAQDLSFHASAKGPLSTAGRPAAVFFGARDTEVLAFSAFGLKLTILDFSTSTMVDICNPKFHHPLSAAQALSIRSSSGHLALLTRASGKDMVSIHHPVTRRVERSWCPDAVDCQGLAWTPDGQWLLIWESPAQGHGLLIYTPDGQHLRTIGAPELANPLGRELQLESGIKICRLSPDGQLCAVGNHSRGVTVLSALTWRESMRLMHPSTIVPKDTLQVDHPI